VPFCLDALELEVVVEMALVPFCLDALELEVVVEMALVKCVQDVQSSVSFERIVTATSVPSDINAYPRLVSFWSTNCEVFVKFAIHACVERSR
jgi:hypothetical protein